MYIMVQVSENTPRSRKSPQYFYTYKDARDSTLADIFKTMLYLKHENFIHHIRAVSIVTLLLQRSMIDLNMLITAQVNLEI